MARRICQTLFALAVAYAAAIGLYALLHYKGADRPDVGTIVADFHVWAGGVFRKEPPPAALPGVLPAPVEVPAPPPTKSETPGAAVEDERTRTLRTVSEVLLPEAERQMGALGQEGPGFKERQSEVLGVLIKVRDLLNPLLDANPQDREVNKLWDRFTQMQRAASKR
jgi:hypothetical protein